ncbi:hypothetical protein N0V83_008548 [Neocucurbitaria cava]|uniref:Uncharacterized protein n=1 Tax=Neocucurbitaria cava TaxID=798079 RepID=A0A9W8Y5D0_9PLEO|nr:hypothetical protein N0V83_008548 [Neocucurbitaria cava]
MSQYTQERPPINYTHVKYDIPLSEHPLGPTFPQTNGSLQVFGDLDPLVTLMAPKDNTTVLADWIYTDKAQLGLHIVSFTDTTLVTLSWLHTLLDALGRKALLGAWTAMLEGREDDVPEFWGYDFDPLEKLGVSREEGEEEEFVLKPHRIQGLSFFKFVFNYLWEVFFYPAEVGRYVCMPHSYFSTIKQQAFRDLSSAPESLLTLDTRDPANPKPFLSDGDTLCAWFTRLLARTNSTIATSPSTRTISIMNVFGMRDLLSTTSPQLLPRGKAYIANCAVGITSLFSQGELVGGGGMPLGHVAARLRRDLVTQGTRTQVEAGQRAVRENGGGAVLYGTGDMAMCVFTNWMKARLFETDFSAAIVEEGEGGKEAW